MPRNKEVVTARVPLTVLLEFILRTAPPDGYTINDLFIEARCLMYGNKYLRVEDILNAAGLLVLEGRADRASVVPLRYLPPANPPNYRRMIEQQASRA